MTQMLSLPSVAEAEQAAIAAALEIGQLPVAMMAMPEQVVERPVSVLARWREQLLGAAVPARG